MKTVIITATQSFTFIVAFFPTGEELIRESILDSFSSENKEDRTKSKNKRINNPEKS